MTLLLRKIIAIQAESSKTRELYDWSTASAFLLNNLLYGNFSLENVPSSSTDEFANCVRESLSQDRDYLLSILVENYSDLYSSPTAFFKDFIVRSIQKTDILSIFHTIKYSDSIYRFLTGDLSVQAFENILSQVQTHAKSTIRNYNRFLLLNFFVSHARNIDKKILDYYSYLFKNAESFLQKGSEVFMKNLPASKSRTIRLNGDIRPALVNPDFENLNVYNLSHFSSALTVEQLEKLLNQICTLAKQKRAQGKDIILLCPFNTDIDFTRKVLANRLDNYNNSSFLDKKNQTFLGYKYFFNDKENLLEIILIPEDISS